MSYEYAQLTKELLSEVAVKASQRFFGRERAESSSLIGWIEGC
jgi:hypothetical protein